MYDNRVLEIHVLSIDDLFNNIFVGFTWRSGQFLSDECVKDNISNSLSKDMLYMAKYVLNACSIFVKNSNI